MHRALVVVCVTVLSALLVATASAGSRRGRDASFTDPTGDSGTAADITTMKVSNDATGQITFDVTTPGQFTSTQTVEIFIDSDRNSSTGDTRNSGVEYDLFQDFSTHTWGVDMWNGSAWVASPSTSTVKVSYTNNEYFFSINKSEIGNTTSFGFWIDSCEADCSTGHEDQAPDQGTWIYDVVPPTTAPTGGGAALHLSVVKWLAPKTVKAGHAYTVAAAVQRSDTSDYVGDDGQIACKATVAGKSVHAVGGFVSVTTQGTKVSVAACVVAVPKTAHGKKLAGSITVSYQGAHISRTFAARVL